MKFSEEFECKTKLWPVSGGLIIGVIGGTIGLIIDDGDISSRFENGFIFLLCGYFAGTLIILLTLFFVNLILSVGDSTHGPAMRLYIILTNTAGMCLFIDWLFLGSRFIILPTMSLLFNGTIE